MRRSFSRFSAMLVLGVAAVGLAQDSANQSWTASSQQGSPGGALNATRTSESHTEVGVRIVDKTSIETLGPDGRYVPYSDIERESVRVNDTTVRNVERAFGRGPDGQRTLIQEREEETRSLPGGDQKVARTISNPDANGALHVIQRELEDSKQLGPSVRATNTIVLTPDVDGRFTPAVRIEQRETKSSDGALESKKSTLLSNGTGGWQLSEVRQIISKPDGGQARTKDESVLRPDSNGRMAVVERTVSRESDAGTGERRETIETYSTNVPGQAGSDSLQRVQRETSVRRTTASGQQSTSRQVERPSPGDPSGSLSVTEEAIDIVRPGADGNAHETQTILTPSSDGQLGQVWVDVGKTDNPSAVQVDTHTTAKSQ